jgi:hypothetical protein
MDKLSNFWAVKSTIQVSGELTTSRGPGTSFEFALSLVEQLFGESVANEVGQLLVRSTTLVGLIWFAAWTLFFDSYFHICCGRRYQYCYGTQK